MPRPILFLDDGGVMNDNSLRGPQWQRLVGEYFPPILGGTPQEWADANRAISTGFFRPEAWRERIQSVPDYASFDYAYQLDWLTQMCALVGVPCPPAEESVELARRASVWIIARVRSAFPGVVDTVRLLHRQGYTLYTASGESSADLEGYLGGMGVCDCFTRLYGPDLINTPPKSSPTFYERMFADAGVEPADALVVDDNLEVLSWATAVGARAVLVSATQPISEPKLVPVIGRLAELPALLETLTT